MATAKKKTNDFRKTSEVPASRVAARPQAAERRVEAPSPRPTAVQAAPTQQAPTASVRTAPSAEQISRRAFEIWEREGRQPGHDVDHWLQAEAELRGA